MTKPRKTEIDIEDDEQEAKPYNVSTIRPSGEEVEEKPTVNQKDYWTSMEQTRLAFQVKGFSVELYNEEQLGGNRRLGENIGARNFFNKLDLSKGDVEERITTMHRRKSLEYYKDAKGREKSKIKEILTYNIILNGFDWLQNPISCKLEHEGLAYEPETRVQVTTDGNGLQTAQYVYNKLRNKFYIPFSKKVVDDLLKKTNSDKDAIKYYGFIPSDQYSTSTKFKCDGYSYEQFLLPWAEFEALAKRNGGPEGTSKWQDKPAQKEWVG